MTTWTLSPSITLTSGRIPKDDADRQQATAKAILDRLAHQPGVVLADDVGMGKTFVALAVAASVVLGDPDQQVVVMVPSAVRDKWPNDWTVFQRDCLGGDGSISVTPSTVESGSEFLKLLDDPPERRKQVIFITHRALTRRLQDPFVKLALLRRAFWRRSSLGAQREAFPRWASQLLRRDFNQQVTRALLAAPPETWRAVWRRVTGLELPDDPVPEAVRSVLGDVNLDSVREALLGLPLRSSKYERQRLHEVGQALREPLDVVWRDALRRTSSRLPLLILDEAHHLKNPNQLRGLFSTEDGGAVDELSGPLAGMFERMLLLTATPFQLGHGELIAVLRLFGSTAMSPADMDRFVETVDELARALDLAQSASLHLDRQWGLLRPADVDGLPAGWWTHHPTRLPERLGSVAAAVATCEQRLNHAAKQLRPWVIRHGKRRNRDYRPGAATLPDAAGFDDRLDSATGEDSHSSIGLPIEGQSVLPFLLATRAQTYVVQRGFKDHKPTKALFADGLASSFEAYLQTRSRTDTEIIDEAPPIPDGVTSAAIEWYLDRIAKAIPREDTASLAAHPKVTATVQRTVKHWGAGEKVLIFCFFRATGRALRQHVSDALAEEITSIARTKFGIAAADPTAMFDALGDRVDSLLRRDRPGGRAIYSRARAIGDEVGLGDADADALGAVTLRFLRTPAFLVRYVDLRQRDGEQAVTSTFDVADGGGLSLGIRLRAFATRVHQLTSEERDVLWEALRSFRTGARRVDAFDDLEEMPTDAEGVRLLPNVELANGETDRDRRLRLMQTFNTPFLPDVLIASSVMAEGVDLHRECRHVIHHDLDWNPSTLEQRTGRVDRIGSRSESTGRPIVVCEPFVTGTQDEKQFRVVKERERWFGVLMGGSVPADEWATERLAERVPLPEELARRLILDLSVWQAPSG
jgi:hypothetical protein